MSLLKSIFVIFSTLQILGIFAQEPEWTLVWQDEFNNQSSLSNNWIFEQGCGGFGNDELQCYVNSSSNVKVEDGLLVITAKLEKSNDGINFRDFTSAQLASKFNTTYGKFEMRARLPRGNFLWPALWLMPEKDVYGGWPASGEIDVMEYRGQRTNQYVGTVHFGPSWDQKGAFGSGNRDFDKDFSEDFHTFGFHWDEFAVRWSCDGNQFHSEGLTKNLWPGFYEKDGQPYDQPFYIIVNLAVGGSFFPSDVYGDFDPEDAKDWEKNTYEIDWIRVYQLQ